MKLDSYEPDECCGTELAEALLAGQLAAREAWACPKCGAEWRPEVIGVLRHWRPAVVAMVFHG